MVKKKKITFGGIFVFILLGVLIASFAFWGVGGSFGQQGVIVAEVGDQEITAAEFANSFRNEVRRYADQFGGYFDTQQALSLGLHRSVLDQLIDRESLDQQAEDLGLLGSDEAIQQAIMELEAFHDITGKFSRFNYDRQLEAVGYDSPKEFEDQVRIDVARTQLLNALTETAIVPKTLVDTIFKFRKESRKAKIATIPASAVEGVGVPTAETLTAYYELSQDRFMHPEYRTLSFIILDPANFAETVELDEDELRTEYDYLYDDFNTPEMRTLEVAMLANEDQANELYARVQAGEDFAAVAAELSGFTREELVLGDRSYAQIEDDFSDVAAERVFNVGLDGITEPAATLLSWQVFHVTNIIPGVERPFEQVIDELRQSLAEDRGIDQLIDAASRIDDEIRVGASVEEIGQALGLEVIIVTTAANGQDQDGNFITQAQLFPHLATAFEIEPLDELELHRVEDSDVEYVVQVDEIIEPALIPLEEIRDQVEQLWMFEERVRISGMRANQAVAAVNNGESLESIAARFGGVVFETAGYRRDRVFTQRELEPAVARLMFSLVLNAAGIERDARGDGYIILQVTDIASIPPAQDAFEYESLLSQLRIEMQNDIFTQFQRAVENDMDITINETLVEQLFDPDFQQQTGVGISQ